MNAGYTHCACHDCFDVTVSSDMDKPELCSECEENDCDGDGDGECNRPPDYEEMGEATQN